MNERQIFLMWYDDSPKVSIQEKLEAAMSAYAARFGGVRANLIMVNEQEQESGAIAGVEIRGTNTIRPNNYWVTVKRHDAA